jgi:hypothetical protein
MSDRPKERGRMILRPRARRGVCLACDPCPAGRVSASELWARAMRQPSGWRVRIGR